MRNAIRLTMALAGLAVLIGCTQFYPPGKQGQSALDDFVYALRWQQFNAAANFMAPEYRQDFLDRFKALKDLTIVDVRLAETRLEADGRRVEATIEMDYYLLPSVAVKTFRIDQTWVYFEPRGELRGHYRIITPFPPFP